MIVYPTGGGTGVVGMAKAFDELEALGLVGPERPRMICVQSDGDQRRSSGPSSRAPPTSPRCPPATTIATGLNVAQNVGHINVLRIVRETGGCALAVTDEAIRGRDPRRVARAPVRLVARRGRHPRRPPRAGRPRR